MAAVLSKIYNPEITTNLPQDIGRKYVEFFSDENRRCEEYRMCLHEYGILVRALHGTPEHPSQIQFYKSRVEVQKMVEYWDRRVKGIERTFPKHVIEEWQKKSWVPPEERQK
jgi:hypothetical protein